MFCVKENHLKETKCPKNKKYKTGILSINTINKQVIQDAGKFLYALEEVFAADPHAPQLSKIQLPGYHKVV